MTKFRRARVLVAVVAATAAGGLAACRGPIPDPGPPNDNHPDPCDECHGDEPGEPGYPGPVAPG